MKNPRASRALRWALDPGLVERTSFVRLSIQNFKKNFLAPLTKILDPLLVPTGRKGGFSMFNIIFFFWVTLNWSKLTGPQEILKQYVPTSSAGRTRNLARNSEHSSRRWFGFTLLVPPKVCKTSTRVFNQIPQENNRRYFVLRTYHFRVLAL